MAPSAGAVGAHTIECTDLASSPAYRAFKEVPLVIAVVLLVWAQYTFAISLCLNYLVLVSRNHWLALLLLIPFEFCWWNAVLNLALCIVRGPGFVERWDLGEGGKRSEEGYRDLRPAEDEAHAPLLADDHDAAASSSSLPPYPIRSRSHSPAGFEFSDAPRTVPPRPNVAADNWMCKSDGSRRFCRKCQVYKPDRSHHCSSCGRCVLKMDHHCPWLGGRCVGIANHKSFLLFISYTSLAAVFGALAAAKGLSDFVSSDAINDGFELGPLNWAFLLLIGGLFALVLGGFTAYHFYLVSVNRTTIENMERSLRVRPSPNSADYALLRPHRPGTSITGDSFPPTTYPRRPPAPGPGADALPDYGVPVYKSDDVLSREERRKLERAAAELNLYDLGSGRENWREVMGRDSKWWEWLLPTRARGTSDGFSFRVNRRHLERLRELTAEIRLVPTDRTHELRYERP